LASRILGVAALRDVLTAFEADGLPSADEMEFAVQRDIERLVGLQNWDGGFPYWRRGQDSIPFNTIHVAHALQRAELKGFEVPGDMQERVLNYLRDIESHYPHWYSLRTRQTLSAYALYTRTLMGDRDTQKARNLLNEAGLENLSLDAVGWIWQTLIDDPRSSSELEAIRLYINNRVVETAGAANFTTYYHDQTYLLLSSNRRTDGILLDTLILDDPESDLIPKLVNGLLAHRTRGHWGNTQENVFVLLSLDRYFNTFEAQTPDFVARIWLGDIYAGGHEFFGRTTETHETKIPMVYLVEETFGGGETQDLILSKDGEGRLYYRLGLRYAPTDLSLDPVDMGFVVQREYEAVDDAEDVTKDEDGVWHIKAGATLPRGVDRPAACWVGDRKPGAGRIRKHSPGPRQLGVPLWMVVVGHLVRAPEHARRTRRGFHLAAVGWRVRIHLYRPRHHTRPISATQPPAGFKPAGGFTRVPHGAGCVCAL